MIITEKLSLSSSQTIDTEFRRHITRNKAISVEDKQFWSKLRSYYCVIIHNLVKIFSVVGRNFLEVREREEPLRIYVNYKHKFNNKYKSILNDIFVVVK